MTTLDYILEGLEAELALGRELGVRSVECARDVLEPLAQTSAASPAAVAAPSPSRSTVLPRPVVPRAVEPVRPPPPRTDSGVYDFAFLHDRPLSAAGSEMMAKIITALGKTAATAPIVHEGPLPRAKVLVVLGGNALKKWFPDVAGAPGQWIDTPRIKNVLVTYSPAFILRFRVVTPEVERIKKAMWTSLKSIAARLKNID